MDPRPERPRMPPEYGIDESATAGMLPWETVRGWLTTARNYWVCTSAPGGRPHAKPVWGIWDDDALLFSTHPKTTTGSNLERFGGRSPPRKWRAGRGDRR